VHKLEHPPARLLGMSILDTKARTVEEQSEKDHSWTKKWQTPDAIPGGTGGGRILRLFHRVEEAYLEALFLE
jgi:hypothetical protein